MKTVRIRTRAFVDGVADTATGYVPGSPVDYIVIVTFSFFLKTSFGFPGSLQFRSTEQSW